MSTDPSKIDYAALFKRALVTLEEQQGKLDALENARREPIAIIGIGCRFPGGANDPESFWKLLRDGVDTVTQVPAERWDVNAFYDPAPDAPGKTYSRWGAFLKNIDQFDAAFFGIAPREAMSMDPQQRLALEVTWEALEHAGCAPAQLMASRTGVFLGVTTGDYAHLQTRHHGPEAIDSYFGSGVAHSIAAGRISYALGLQGPSIALDTACSSSLVAAHLACVSLRNKECDIALAGGVNLILSPDGAITASRSRMMSFEGRCKTFDAQADGYVRGEGCGIVVLKRLSDALANGDSIVAVIAGSALNQDGRSNGLTAPNGLAQEEVIRTALANANVKPGDVSYVEAHGTGTSLGDPIEVRALGAVFGEGHSKTNPLMIGSVKTNVGHLEATAGIVGLIKVALALKHQEIPPHLHFHDPNPYIAWDTIPVVVPTQPTPWVVADGAKRIAGLSSFGFSGTNAHFVITQAPDSKTASIKIDRPLHLLTLSARNDKALRESATRFERYLAEHPAESIADICFTANTGRSHFGKRASFVADSTMQAREKLSAWLAAETASRDSTANGDLRIAFLFTGQGAQYVGMGKELYETQPTFRKTLERCDEILRPILGESLLDIVFAQNENAQSKIDETKFTQPALFAIEYALAELWRGWGIEPTFVMGHSVGEYVAACVAGVFGLEDGLKLIAERARLMQELPRNGAMAAVFADVQRVSDAIRPFADTVSIAALNGPENIVISGVQVNVQTILRRLEDQGIKSRALTVSHAFHSPLIEPMLAQFERVASTVKYVVPRIGLISNVSGTFAAESDMTSAAYWRQHIRQPVQFATSMETLNAQGCNAFVEIGPSPTLLSMAQRCLPSASAIWLPSLRQGRADWQQLLESLGELYVHGADINWAGLDRDYVRHRLALPTYPFQRERYWLDYKPVQRQPIARRQPLLGARLNLAHSPDTFVWEGELSTQLFPYLADHQVQNVPILPATAYIEMVMEGATEVIGAGPLVISEIENRKVLLLPEGANPVVQVVLSRGADEKITCQVYSRQNRGDAATEVWTLHMTCQIQRQAEGVSPRVDLDSIRGRCTQTIDGSDFYRALSERGNQWGPASQGMVQIWRGADEALSRLHVPASLESEFDAYIFHPAVGDAGGHVLAGTIALERSGDSKGGAFVLGGVHQVRFYQRPRGRELWAWAHLRRDEAQPANVLVGDVHVVDDAGAVIAETLGARLWYLAPDEQASILANPEDWYYELEWVQKNQSEKRVELPGGSWLLVSDRNGVSTALRDALSAQGEECRFVDAPSDLEQAIREVPAIRGVVHLASLDLNDVGDASGLGCASVLQVAQSLNRLGKSARMWLVTCAAQAVKTESGVFHVAQAPLWGFGRTMAVEHSELWGGLIDLDPDLPAQDSAAQIAQALLHPDGEDQVVFRGTQRFAARLTRKHEFIPHVFRVHADAYYLVTGGLGGLGLTIAQWLVEQGARRLILVSRTALPPRETWDSIEPTSRLAAQIDAIRRMESCGATIQLVAADVADEVAMRTLVEPIRSEIRGVVHAAGVMQYQALMEHTVAQMNTVMRAKVQGSWVLHRLFPDASLDFFVLFSSASALLSSPLMASYAAANSFLDALAHYRHAQGLSALSVNWGSWSSVGMGAEFGGDRAAVERGMSTISPAQGLEALGRLLRQSSAQTGFIPVNWRQWQSLYPAFTSAPFLSQLIQPATQTLEPSRSEFSRAVLLAADPSSRQNLLEKYLIDQGARVLRLNSSELDPKTPLNQMGLDSLMAVELKNRIELDLSIVVPMVKLLQGPPIAELVPQVLEQIRVDPVSTGEPSAGKPTNAEHLLAQINNLTDDQVNSLLTDLLAEEIQGQSKEPTA